MVATPVKQKPKKPNTPITENLRIPHDPVNEQVIIAAAIVDPDVRSKLVLRLPSDSFYAIGHAEAWRAIADMHKRGLQFDPATIRQLTGGAVDSDYLSGLVAARPVVPPNLAYHVEALEWDRSRIEAARGPVAALLDALRDPASDPDRVRTLARQVGGSFSVGSLRYLRDPGELVREQIGEIRKRQSGLACYPYGVDGLDRYGENDGEKAGAWRLVPGAAPKKITVITGLSGSGKTTFTALIAISLANQGRRVLFGAWEQGSGNTLELMAVQSLGLSRTAFMTGAITNAEIEAVQAEMERLSEFVRFFEIPFGRGVVKGEKMLNDRHLDTIAAYITDTGSEVFIADLWRRALRQFEPDEEEHALYRQQAIAQETGAHCILLHQQRLKDVELRGDKRPTREGLKGSGAWVEVPDTILAVHRPALWKACDDNVIEVDVLKQRFGPWPLAIEFEWNPDTGAIHNGRTIDYVQPGQEGEFGEFIESKPATRRKGRRQS
jgi:energy-coupling factor transporter ATP-binding protein EcfA2